eukprot:1158154-Pelagomonas_calceolata.AAC.4
MAPACWAAAVCRLGKGLVSGQCLNYTREAITSRKNPVGYISRDIFRGFQCPVLAAFLYSKRPWQQGMSYVLSPLLLS